MGRRSISLEASEKLVGVQGVRGVQGEGSGARIQEPEGRWGKSQYQGGHFARGACLPAAAGQVDFEHVPVLKETFCSQMRKYASPFWLLTPLLGLLVLLGLLELL